MKDKELDIIEQIRLLTERVAELCIEKDSNCAHSLQKRINRTVNEAIWCVEMDKIISEQIEV
jgi:hypothetical protein